MLVSVTSIIIMERQSKGLFWFWWDFTERHYSITHKTMKIDLKVQAGCAMENKISMKHASMSVNC